MPNLSGKWVVAKVEGMNEMLDKLKVPAEKRDPAKIQSASVEIQQDGDELTITATEGLGLSAITNVTIGGPYETELFGRIMKGTSAWEGNTLVMRGDSGTITREEIIDDKLEYSIELAGSKASLTFNRA